MYRFQFSNLVFIAMRVCVLCALVISPLGLAAQPVLAQGLTPPVSTDKVDGHGRVAGDNPPAPLPHQTPATPIVAAPTNILQDPSFEAFTPNPYWTEASATFGTPLCTISGCSDGGGTAGPRTGIVWSWFGGISAPLETSSLSQSVTISGGQATLEFYLWIGFAQDGSDAADAFSAKIDGVTVFSANATQIGSYPTYTLVSLDVSAFADNAPHLITLSAETTNQMVSFNVDDVTLLSNQSALTISGNAGAAGAVLSYTDGTPKTATADGAGLYSFSVPSGWSGTVTPSLPGYYFSPINRTYSNVLANQTGQDYTAFPVVPGTGDTVGIFRPSNGALYLKNTNITGFADYILTFGLPMDYPVVGDWNGDGIGTIGVYRNGFFYLRNSNTNGFADMVFAFGSPGDQPVVGDWNGDGIDTIGVYRTTTGAFFLRNTNSAGPIDMSFSLGISGDVGIAGDWNGDGVATTGVFRPTNGALYLKNANSTGFADVILTYGLPGDKPVIGDWNGDGLDTIGVMRGNVFYLRNSNTNGFAEINVTLGIHGDRPIAGDWNGAP